MKRASKLVAVLAAAVLITTGCSSSSSDNAGADVKVGLAYDIGGRGDKSFNDSAALGLDEAKAEFGVEAKEVTVTTGSDSEREDKLRLLAKAGYNPIIAVGSSTQDQSRRLHQIIQTHSSESSMMHQ